jgi:hypothetical protein
MKRGGLFQGNVLGSRNALGCDATGCSGLGAINIPWWCWDKEGFKSAHSACWADANAKADLFGTFQAPSECDGASTKAECHQRLLDKCVQTMINQMCPWSKPPAGGKPASGTPCSSAAAIKYVQSQIGTVADGIWGPKSQAALTKSGKTFKQILPDCVGAAPSTGVSIAPAPAVPATVPTTADVVPYEPPSEGFLGIPTIAWAGAAGIVAVLFMAAKKKKGRR